MLPPELSPWIGPARELHRRVPVFASYLEFYGYDSLFAEQGGRQCDLGKLDAAGLRVFGCAVANGGPTYFQTGPNTLEPAGPPEWALKALRVKFESAMAEVRRCPRVRVVETAADLDPDPLGGKLAIIPLVTCHSYMTEIAVLDEFFRRGLRISHSAGSTCALWCRDHGGNRNLIAGKRPPVFNDYGRAVVARMNELGIVVDLAHMSDESAEEIIRASARPVIDGHTGSRTAVPHSRGLSDRILRLMAEKGGVAGIHFADHLFTAKVHGTKYPLPADKPAKEPAIWAYNRWLLAAVSDPDERARLRKDRARQQQFFREHNIAPDAPPPATRLATVADMADHVEYLVNVMGIEHVGLGGDVNGIGDDQWPAGMDHVGELPHLTAELMRRGWREADLVKFLSSNWKRVFGECLPRRRRTEDQRPRTKDQG